MALIAGILGLLCAALVAALCADTNRKSKLTDDESSRAHKQRKLNESESIESGIVANRVGLFNQTENTNIKSLPYEPPKPAPHEPTQPQTYTQTIQPSAPLNQQNYQPSKPAQSQPTAHPPLKPQPPQSPSPPPRQHASKSPPLPPRNQPANKTTTANQEAPTVTLQFQQRPATPAKPTNTAAIQAKPANYEAPKPTNNQPTHARPALQRETPVVRPAVPEKPAIKESAPTYQPPNVVNAKPKEIPAPKPQEKTLAPTKKPVVGGNPKINNLMQWIQNCTHTHKNVDINNFTTSWKNGMAFCALIHHHDTSLFDYDSLNPNNAHANLKLAFDCAEKMGIPRLMEPEDFLDIDVPDRLSTITYLFEWSNKLNV